MRGRNYDEECVRVELSHQTRPTKMQAGSDGTPNFLVWTTITRLPCFQGIEKAPTLRKTSQQGNE